MSTAIIHPTTYGTGTGVFSNPSKAADGNDSTYANKTVYSTPYYLSFAIAPASIQNTIPTDSIIDDIQIYILLKPNGVRVYDVAYDYRSSGPSYNSRVGSSNLRYSTGFDETISGSSLVERSISVSSGNKQEFLSNGFWWRFKFVSASGGKNVEVYTVKLIVTYHPSNSTVTFDSCGGSSVSSKTVSSGSTYGTLPTPTRTGYSFSGWYKCRPVFNSGYFNGSRFEVVSRDYMYTDKIAVHIEGYMPNWSDISSNSKQLISCTEGGGWGIGWYANTVGHGAKINIKDNGYKGVNFAFPDLSSGWHSFDIAFNGSSFSGWVDNTNKGTVSTGGNAIKYHESNVIFIGAEAGGNATTPGGNYFIGNISSVFIANQGEKLTAVTANDTVSGDHTLYACWRINNYNLTVNAGTGGTVTGGGTYAYNETATITATPSSGYRFVKWSDGNTNASRTVTVTANKTYTAEFVRTTVTATFKNYDGTVLQTVTTNSGSTPSYTATTPTKPQTAEYTYSFSGWSPQVGAITADTVYTAQFTDEKRKYTIAVTSGIGGTVSGGGSYEYGTTVTIKAIADAGYEFAMWSDGNTNAERAITVTEAITLSAFFLEIILPEISNVSITPNPVNAGQGFIISVSF